MSHLGSWVLEDIMHNLKYVSVCWIITCTLLLWYKDETISSVTELDNGGGPNRYYIIHKRTMHVRYGFVTS